MRQIKSRGACAAVLAAALAVLVCPAGASADPFIWFNLDLNYNYLSFGSGVEYAHVTDGGFSPEWSEIFVSDWPGTPLSGEFDLVSGPLLSVTPAGGDSTFVYAAGGTVRFTMDFLPPSGVMHHGWFVGSLGELTINPDQNGGGGSMWGDIGPGLLDRRTAALIGMRRHTQGGELPAYLDTYDTPDDPYREVASFGEMYIYGTAPEPSTFALLGIAGLCAVRRAWKARHHRISRDT